MSDTSLPQSPGAPSSAAPATPPPVITLGIPKELSAGERRVAATPDTAERLQKKLGFRIAIQSGAGAAADFPDTAYEAVGCKIVASEKELFNEANVILKVRAPQPQEIDMLRADHMLISYLAPAQNPDLLKSIAAKKASAIAIDTIPRISRAQKEDALSSMANIAGYRAVVEAANIFPRFFTGQVTAAGKIPPAKILVIGAGVAGLAAIGAGRALGAIVRAFDVRPAVKEQIQSMGAEFLEVKLQESGEGEGGYAKEMSPEFIAAEMALFAKQAKDVDIIVTTALIPGRPAPKLITTAMVESMKEGSVIVDLAAETGGNCDLTVPGQAVKHGGVTIIGYTDLPSRMAPTASQLYGMNLYHLLDDMGGATKYRVNLEDEVVRGALVVDNGEITWPPPKPKTAPPSAPKPAASTKPIIKEKKKSSMMPQLIAGVVIFAALVFGAPASFLAHFTVFVLAVFVGWQIIWNVTPALHTPLMSVTNAISGIIIIGGMLQIGGNVPTSVMVLGFIAILLATINVAGGFLVTQRMLKMFRK
jgi:H+-translocating NAD(P) transhydrogenase subunit alpha